VPGLDLTAIIRRKLSTSDLADPKEIAAALIDDGDVPRSRYGEALLQTLPHLVRETIRSERNGPRDGHNSPDAHIGSTASRPVRSGRANKSWRWERTKCYGLRVYVGDCWKLLGDCTWDDLSAIVELYAAREFENGLMRRRYQALIGLRDEFKRAKNVRDVPAERVDEILHCSAEKLASIEKAMSLRGVA